MPNPLIALNGMSDAPVIASPAYQLPEVPSDATVWAEAYCRTYAKPAWMVPDLANAWIEGKIWGRLESAR